LLGQLSVIVALGRTAFENLIRIYREWGHDLASMDFIHGAQYELGKNLPDLVVSYHPSQQNTQTGRLTHPMFDSIWSLVKNIRK